MATVNCSVSSHIQKAYLNLKYRIKFTDNTEINHTILSFWMVEPCILKGGTQIQGKDAMLYFGLALSLYHSRICTSNIRGLSRKYVLMGY